MKAWIVREKGGFNATVVFAETRKIAATEYWDDRAVNPEEWL